MLNNDQISELLTRSSFNKKLDLEISRCLQEKILLSLMVLDIDHLSSFTKNYGCECGDSIIQQIGNLFQGLFTGRISTCHYGGDEFLAAIPEMKPEKVFELGEKLIRDLEENPINISVNGKITKVNCTASIGIATLPLDARDRDELTIKAKQAMYRAKEDGGNKIYLYEEKDYLTGLLNHYGIIKKLDTILNLAAENKFPVSIISIDIDDLKNINDQLGNQMGDEVIRQLTTLLHQKFSENIFLGRYGGDQFIVLLPNFSADNSFIQAEQFRNLVDHNQVEMTIDNRPYCTNYSISAGVATYPNDANQRVDLMRKANEALYRAKINGKNQVCLPTSVQMVLKANYYTPTQLEKLSALAKSLDTSEAFLLREALDDLLLKYIVKQRFM